MTRLSTSGVPGRSYSDFTKGNGNRRDVGEITGLAPWCTPMMRYGAFGRQIVIPVPPPRPSGGGGGGSGGGMSREDFLRYQSFQDNDEALAAMIAMILAEA